MLPERNEERGIVTTGFLERKTSKIVLSLSSIAFFSLKGLSVSNCSLRERFTGAETEGDSKTLW
jgi:hypothetical protein